MAQWVGGITTQTESLPVWITVRAQAWAAGCPEVCERQPIDVFLLHWYFSPSHSLSLPLTLKMNKYNLLKNWKQNNSSSTCVRWWNYESLLTFPLSAFFVFSLYFLCYFLVSYITFCSFTVVCIFSHPVPPTPSKPISLPCFHPPPWFCLCVLYSSS